VTLYLNITTACLRVRVINNVAKGIRSFLSTVLRAANTWRARPARHGMAFAVVREIRAFAHMRERRERERERREEHKDTRGTCTRTLFRSPPLSKNSGLARDTRKINVTLALRG